MCVLTISMKLREKKSKTKVIFKNIALVQGARFWKPSSCETIYSRIRVHEKKNESEEHNNDLMMPSLMAFVRCRTGRVYVWWLPLIVFFSVWKMSSDFHFDAAKCSLIVRE